MYEMAKKAREAMKGKARKLAAEKDQKVDSSDWSPAEPLNADVKTGLRPISRRAYKKGGKVEGEACGPMHMGRKARKSGGKVSAKEMAEEKSEATEYAKAKINRNVKAANEEREGVKHVGGMKKGGRAKRAEGGTNKDGYFPREKWDESKGKWVPLKPKPPFPGSDKEIGPSGPSDHDNPDKFRPGEMKKGGRAKREDGGGTKFGMTTPRDHDAPRDTSKDKLSYHEETGEPIYTRSDTGEKYKKGGRAKKMDGGTLNKMVSPAMRRRIEEGSKTPTEMPKNPPMPPRRPAEPVGGKGTEPVGLDADQVKRLEEGRKHGGRSARKDGGEIAVTLAEQEKIQKKQAAASEPHRGKAEHYKSGGRAKKMMGGPMADPRMDIVKKKAMDFGSGAQGTPYKKGGRIERKAGGRTKGKTNINIVIAAGKPAGQDMMQPPPGGPPMPPPGVPVPLPGGGAPGGMPMGAPMGGGMPLPPPPAPPAMPGAPAMGRKAGGRVTKIAKSYKDMEAGSGGGEGRLQKTDIAKTGKGAPTFRRGGKVYRSYKDMDAGSGSGLGRIEKTEIQARKG